MTKKGKPIQIQSPENYIRTRARSLSIFECLVNDDWKDNGIANVVVARKHTNGNLTVAIYLVDLYCLGIKDTMYMFNVSENSYREKLNGFPGGNVLSEIDYTLAHNIIFAAIEFAGDYGFIPHKTFTSVTKYMLEEDTDEIELIDIECGLDGKPAYIQGPYEDPATVSRILKQLDRTAGKENHNITILAGEPKFEPAFDEYDDEDDNEFEDDFDGLMSYDEAVSIFSDNIDDIDSLDKGEAESFFESVDVLFDSMIDKAKCEQYYDYFMDDLDIETWSDEIPDEMLGLPLTEIRNPDLLKSKLNPILQYTEKKFKKGIKLLGELKKDFGDIPLLYFLELHFEEDKALANFKQKLLLYQEKFPQYPLIKLTSMIHNYLDKLDQTPDVEIVPLHELYPHRTYLQEFEMQQYLVYVVFVVAFGNNHSRLNALDEALMDLDFPDDFMELTKSIIVSHKIKAVSSLLEISS